MMFNASKDWFKRKFAAWLAKRQPAATEVELTQSVIYILPSRFGWWFVFLIALLYLMGTNYQNNLILLLSFMLLSLLMVTMLLAFLNMHQLKLSVKQDARCFAPERAQLPLALSGKSCQMLHIGLRGQRQRQLVESLSQQHRLALALPTLSRGYYPFPRLELSSTFPLGLFRCWSYPALTSAIWVYPEAIEQIHANTERLAEQASKQTTPHALLEPDDVKSYQAGDSPKRILWRKLASTPEQPVVRSYSGEASPLPHWIKIPALQGAALESVLSHACFQLLALEQQGHSYGLQTQSVTLAPAKGALHLERCLQELALC
ncbi:MAG: DUF58 domain-containing protein [Alishewanella sp.]|nr:DUF58 domain-containing protein [Alishewanella sp.]MDP5186669.1 DUF58 domain-containing protein [Alishewanella sp.]